jgi:hypothetical protein
MMARDGYTELFSWRRRNTLICKTSLKAAEVAAGYSRAGAIPAGINATIAAKAPLAC